MKIFGRYSMCLLACLIMSASAALAADDIRKEDQKKSLDKAEQWEKAALTRELAATTEQMHADDLLTKAQDLRQKSDTDTDSDRENDFLKVGEIERAAADLYVLSVANYDKAAANWTSAAEEYRKYKELERLRNARNRVDVATRNATYACSRAAEIYEIAANAFSLENANDPPRTGQALEKAATWRENLAARK